MSALKTPREAIIDLLRSIDASPDETIHLHKIGVPLVTKGFAEHDLFDALRVLESQRIIELDYTKNALRLLDPNVLLKNL